MKVDNLFAELKRRNVYRVAVVYAVTAWLLAQAASILLSTFEAPAWVMKVVVLGFPIALILARAFELTPALNNCSLELNTSALSRQMK